MGINAMAIFFLTNASSKNKSNTGRIAEIEQAMGKAIKKLETQGADMKKADDALTSINSKLKETNTKVTQLEKDIVKTQETARFDIENLNKAKNAMQNKISVLADKINESKNAKQQ
jgi:predicted  nucleic acid-binding Zn-ribbon protein